MIPQTIPFFSIGQTGRKGPFRTCGKERKMIKKKNERKM